jgi:hypothetical protein
MKTWEKVQENLRPVAEMFKPLKGRVLDRVEVAADKGSVAFHFQDAGPPVRYHVTADCCSSSWIEHCETPSDDMSGARIYFAEDGGVVDSESEGEYGEVVQVYRTTFETSKGTIVLEYRNSSNGYYGGSLELSA